MPNIGENLAKLDAMDQDIAAANIKLNSISTADQSMTQFSYLVKNLFVAIPENVDSPDLITEIETIANQNQVSLPSLTPPTGIESTSSSTGSASSGLSTNLTVVGSFQNINNFINSLETSIRYSKVNNITISSGDSDLTAAINFNVYSRPVSATSSELIK
jgi:hypothetical protein